MGEFLWYLACPVSPEGDETVESNLKRGLKCLAWLNRHGLATIAPWIELCYALDDNNTTDREIGMRVDLNVLRRCDGIVLCGPRISSGMYKELELMERLGKETEHHIGPDWWELLTGEKETEDEDNDVCVDVPEGMGVEEHTCPELHINAPTRLDKIEHRLDILECIIDKS